MFTIRPLASSPRRFMNAWLSPGASMESAPRRIPARGSRGPAFALREGEDVYVMTADLPGVTEKQLDVSVEGSQVTLKITRAEPTPEPGGRVHRQERWCGDLERTFEFGAPIDSGRAGACLAHGQLTVTLPKHAGLRPRRIPVSSSPSA